MPEKIDRISEELQEVEAKSPGNLDISLLSNRGTKIEKLIENSDEGFTYNVRNQDYTLKFAEPIFLSSIRFFSSQKAPLFDVEIEKLHPVSIEKVQSLHSAKDDRQSIATIDQVCKTLTFRKKAPGFLDLSTDELKKIEIFGFRISEIDSVRSAISKVGNLKDDLEKTISESRSILQTEAEILAQIKTAIETKENEKGELENEIETIESEISELSEKRTELTSEITSRNSTAEGIKSQISSLQVTHDGLTKEIIDLHKNIAGAKSQLIHYTKDLGLISNEYGSFFKQGNRYIWLYVLLGIIPTGIAGYVTYELFYGASKMAVLFENPPTMSVQDLLLIRLPFVTIAAFLIHAAYSVIKLLAQQIFDIQEEKMMLTKIGIIAHDIVEKSMEDLEISDEEAMKINISLRLSLLQSFLEHQLTTKPEKREKVQGLLKRVLDRLPNPANILNKDTEN